MDFITPGQLTKVCKDPPNCSFSDFMALVKLLIDDLIIFATFCTVVVFVYAGIKLLTSGGNEGAMKDAKSMIWKVVKGYIVILTSWLVVYTITHTLLKPEFLLLQ